MRYATDNRFVLNVNAVPVPNALLRNARRPHRANT
jgi:hypothetical protein